ncbi:hypothetical protein K488DRAFT_84994 [Vararia minispora EC-137]|uniref:Uncharacterized protein n=1 Tax=Vararia minispora EC-137 TaxID=1314806 RepID=A0ACB8QNN6_9AGAM|nr:hypothetical protein K488DRAFT_84994 [Vararia minispora EC-137]
MPKQSTVPSSLDAIPPEIIEQIFVELQRLDADVRKYPLDYSELWTDIPTHDLRWTTLFIERSKSALLTVRIGTSPGRVSSEAVAVCLKCMQRVSVFHAHLSGSNSFVASIHAALRESNYPDLKELSLSRGWVPRNVFTVDSLPNLRSLSVIDSYFWPFPELLRPGIIHLHLSCEPMHSSRWRSLDDALTVLKEMPLLESLTLEKTAFPRVAKIEGDPTALPDIELPHLQQLTLAGTVEIIRLFLQHLTAPLEDKLHLHIDHMPLSSSDNAPQEHASGLMDRIFRTEQPQASYRTVRFYQTSSSHCSNEKTVVECGEVVSADPPAHPRVFRVEFAGPFSPRLLCVHQQIATGVCARLPLARVEHVVLHGRPFSPSFGARVLAPLGAGVKRLRVEGSEAADTVLRPFQRFGEAEEEDVDIWEDTIALLEGAEQQPANEGPALLQRFTHLHTLEIVDVNFTRRGEMRTELFSRFLAACGGIRSHRIQLEGCDLTMVMEMQLREALGEEGELA